jgi:CRISPR-associated endonuclease/helicase Cas3
VLVPYGEQGFKLLDQLRHRGPERWLMRKLQRLSVNVYESEFNALRALGAVDELQPGIWGVCVTNAYDEQIGLLPADQIYSGKPKDSVI